MPESEHLAGAVARFSGQGKYKKKSQLMTFIMQLRFRCCLGRKQVFLTQNPDIHTYIYR